MDLMDFMSTLGRLDDGDKLFSSASLFISNGKTGEEFEMMSFSMWRNEFFAINGGIFSQVNDIKLKNFVTDVTGGSRVSIDVVGNFNMKGRWISVGRYLGKALNTMGKRANLTVKLENHDLLELSDVSSRVLPLEISDYLFKYFDSADKIAEIPLGYIKVVRGGIGENATIIMKERFS